MRGIAMSRTQQRKEPQVWPEPIRIARAVYDAYVRKDRKAIESLIADDFQFTSPLDNRLNRETYLERCWPNSETTKNVEFRNLGRSVFRLDDSSRSARWWICGSSRLSTA
jgi:Domain of unknown function (DUF4440)